METLKEKWDRVLLLVVALLVTAVGALFIKKALAYPATFEIEEVGEDNTLSEPEVAKVEGAQNFLSNEVKWVLPVRGETAPKPLPLFVSIPIVLIGQDQIDMNDPNARPVRPPATNQWLLENDLNFLDAKVLEQDSDQDGFTNLEEWTAKTLPKDPADHPPYADKLVFVSRQQQSYTVKFAAMPDDSTYQVIRMPSAAWPRRETFMMHQGDVSKDGQFRVDSFKRNEATNNLGIKVDASELSVTYVPTGEPVILIRNVDKTIPTYYAELQFSLPGAPEWKEFVKKGDFFSLPIDPETKYKLIDIQENEAQISFEPEPGKERILKIGKSS